jgi:membrane protein DedA with SNARE-associated domain
MTYIQEFLNYLHTLPGALVYLLLGLSAFVENIFPPIPGDTITAFGALLVGLGKLSFFWVYFSTTLGSLLGFLFLFWVGRYLGRRFFVKKNYRFLKAENIVKSEAWFGRYGYFLVVGNRFLPGIRSAISVAGGILRLKWSLVTLLAFVSCAVWNLIWLILGFELGNNWETIEARLSSLQMKYNIFILIIFCLVIVAVFVIKKNRKKS